MKLVLTYYGSGSDGRASQVTLPVEVESPEAARAEFRAAIEYAQAHGAPYFERFGARHYLHNFLAPTDAARIEVSRRQADLKGLRMPEVVEQGGQLYWLRLPMILTVDEWFEAAARGTQG